MPNGALRDFANGKKPLWVLPLCCRRFDGWKKAAKRR